MVIVVLNNLPIFIWCERVNGLVSSSYVTSPLRECFIAFDFHLKKSLMNGALEHKLSQME